MFRANFRRGAGFARRVAQTNRRAYHNEAHSGSSWVTRTAIIGLPLAGYVVYKYTRGSQVDESKWEKKVKQFKKHKEVPEVAKLEEVLQQEPEEQEEEPEVKEESEAEPQQEAQEEALQEESQVKEEAEEAKEEAPKEEPKEESKEEPKEVAKEESKEESKGESKEEEELKEPEAAEAVAHPGEAEKQGAYDPETGEINWDCPCLGGMAHGPCGEEFKDAFSCFVYSTAEPKGFDCIEKFKFMQDCFRKHPDVYAEELSEESPIEPPKESTEKEVEQAAETAIKEESEKPATA